MKRTWKYAIAAAIVCVLALIPVAHIAYNTVVYRNYLTGDCPSETFCWIKKLHMQIPAHFIGPLLNLSRTEGRRVYDPSRRQKAISLQRLEKHMPSLVTWYEELTTQVSQEIGTPVLTTPLSQPNSLCLIVYEKEGDFIDWHFDTNNYTGRYFTLLFPVTTEPTCGHYEYRDSAGEVQSVELTRGEALLFEGDRVFHRGAELCAGQRRVLLSCTFCTSQQLNWTRALFQRIKNLGIFGE